MLVDSLQASLLVYTQEKNVQAFHLRSMNKSVGMIVLIFDSSPPDFTPDIEKTLEILTGSAAYILYSEQRQRKANKLTAVVSQLTQVAEIIANATEEKLDGAQLKETLVKKTLEAARKITDQDEREQGISHIGFKKQRQVLHPDYLGKLPTPEDRFLTIQYLFFDEISAPTPEQEKDLKARLDLNTLWKTVPLDIDPKTGQPIDPQEYQFGIAGYVALNAKDPNVELLYNNIPEYRKTHGNYIPLNEDSQSQLSVPVNFRDEAIGVISVEHPDLYAYTKYDRDNLQLLATLLAGAFSYLEKNNRLEAFQKALHTIDQYKDKHPREQPLAIIEIAKEILDAQAGGLYMYDTETRKLEKFVITSERESPVDNIDPGALSTQGMAGYLFEHDTLDYLIEDDYNISRYRHAAYEKEKRIFPSVLKVKMRSQSVDESPSNVIGILNVDAKENRQFTVDEAKVLLSLADQAGLSLTRAQAFQEQKNWRSIAKLVLDDILAEEYTAVEEIDGPIASANKSALHRIAERVLEIVRTNQSLPSADQVESGNSVAIYLYHPQSLRLQYQIVGAGLPRSSFYEQYQDDSDRRLIQPIFRDPWPSSISDFHIVRDVSTDQFSSQSPNFTKNNNIRAYIAIKLRIHPHLVGVLFINFDQQYDFDSWFVRKVLEPIRQGVESAIKYLDQQRRSPEAQEGPGNTFRDFFVHSSGSECTIVR